MSFPDAHIMLRYAYHRAYHCMICAYHCIYAHIIAHITAYHTENTEHWPCAYHTENTEHWPITQNSNRANIASQYSREEEREFIKCCVHTLFFHVFGDGWSISYGGLLHVERFWTSFLLPIDSSDCKKELKSLTLHMHIHLWHFVLVVKLIVSLRVLCDSDV